ncbi:MAG: hypothetical protein DWQ42_07770 [Planctomycetota bacterium]|nr:MAG: hypothetical protein DWQ42_07770 [Planctomycetota bacterium]REK44370.1 MAG: hypothetical protein DWQ46_09915 [Planctomycetota bacterium]
MLADRLVGCAVQDDLRASRVLAETDAISWATRTWGHEFDIGSGGSCGRLAQQPGPRGFAEAGTARASDPRPRPAKPAIWYPNGAGRRPSLVSELDQLGK